MSTKYWTELEKLETAWNKNFSSTLRAMSLLCTRNSMKTAVSQSGIKLSGKILERSYPIFSYFFVFTVLSHLRVDI